MSIIKALFGQHASSKPDGAHLVEVCKSFRRAMRVTAGARFNASKRLLKHDKRLNVSVAVLSCFIILLSIFQALKQLEDAANQNLTIFNIILSVSVLILALLQYASSDAVHAEQHHRCALEIEEVRRQLDIILVNPSEHSLMEVVNRYNSVLRNSNINHDDDDRSLYICDRPELGFDLDRIDCAIIKTRVMAKALWPYLIVASMGLLIVWLIFFYAAHHLKVG